MIEYFFSLAAILFVYMSAWFVVSIIRARNDVADVAWGIGFVIMAWAAYVLSGAPGVRGALVCSLVTLWGVRLALHIYRRNKGKPEDYRYQAWRTEWGRWFYLRSYLQVYLLQGVLLFMIAMPVFLIQHAGILSVGVLDILGICVWVLGFFFESVGDAQLARFIKDPAHKGQLMQSGLWAYARHPNYFGEVTQWWGIWIIALGSAYGWVGIIGPLTITFLILKVSGIPLLEKKMAENPAFAEYKRRVSMFIPLPPKA